MNKLYIPSQIPGEFTLSFLLKALVEYVQLNEKIPGEILLTADHFVKFCYYSDQFVEATTLIGIPVSLVFKEPQWHIKKKNQK
jgi:hypothetical protein